MKNRDSVYLVVREVLSGSKAIGAVCGCYSTVEAADEKAAAYNQLWKDRGWSDRELFSVIISTYYDE